MSAMLVTASAAYANSGTSEKSADQRSDSSSGDCESSGLRLPCIRNGKPSWTTLPRWRVEELGQKYGSREQYEVPWSEDDPPKGDEE